MDETPTLPPDPPALPREVLDRLFAAEAHSAEALRLIKEAHSTVGATHQLMLQLAAGQRAILAALEALANNVQDERRTTRAAIELQLGDPVHGPRARA